MKEEPEDNTTARQDIGTADENNLTERERSMFRKGFMVAMNFIHHHDERRRDRERSSDDKRRYKEVLELNMPDSFVGRALSGLSGGGQCDPGWCWDGARCVLCSFEFAIDPRNFPNFPDA